MLEQFEPLDDFSKALEWYDVARLDVLLRLTSAGAAVDS